MNTRIYAVSAPLIRFKEAGQTSSGVGIQGATLSRPTVPVNESAAVHFLALHRLRYLVLYGSQIGAGGGAGTSLGLPQWICTEVQWTSP